MEILSAINNDKDIISKEWVEAQSYATESWVESNYISDIDSAMVTNALGYTPANNTSLANYLPLSGGTLKLSGADAFVINRATSSGNPTLISFFSNDAFVGRLGYNPTTSQPVATYNGAYETLLHTGNYSDYALPLSGGSLTGFLYMNGGSDGIYIGGKGIYWHNAANEYVRNLITFTDGGYIGIGTNDPQYKLDVVGKVRVSDELIVTNPTGIRWAYGDYGTLFRNDGQHFYILFTDSGGALTGSWNSLRPFRISLTTGDVTMEHNLKVIGQVAAEKEMSSQNRFVLFAPYAESKGVSFGYMKATIANQYNIGMLHLGTNYGGTANITDTSMDYTAISMYRHVVGIGKEYDYASIRAIYDAGADLGVTKGILVGSSKMIWDGVGLSVSTGATFNGAVTMSSTLTVKGASNFKSTLAIEGDATSCNIAPQYHNTYALGSLTKSWMSLFLVSSNNRSVGADPIVINDSRETSGYQAIRFMRNGADYAALQWFHDGFNSSAYTWNKVSCLNLDTAAGGAVTIGAWSDPTLIIWKDSKSIDARGALTVGAGATFNGKLSANNGLEVNNGATVYGDLHVEGNIIVTGEASSGGTGGGTTGASVVSYSGNYTSGLSIGNIIINGVNNTVNVPYATNNSYGLVKVNNVRSNSPYIQTGGTNEDKNYGVELTSDGKMFVNVPWSSNGEARYASLEYINGKSYSVYNGDVLLAETAATLTLDFSNVIPYDAEAPCVLYILKLTSKTLNITPDSNIVILNQSNFSVSTSVVTCSANIGLMLIWNSSRACWHGFMLK